MRSPSVFSLFWLFGLLNNILYVVILSAAVDLVGATIPKSTVLLADILPSLIIKVSSPFFIHKLSYNKRIYLIISLSFSGVFFVTFPFLFWRILGIILASSSSGLGEVTFLQLTHFYGKNSLQGWSSGTGGAGIFGSFAYLFFTTILRFEVKTALLLFSFLPFGFLFYFTLPGVLGSQSAQNHSGENYEETYEIDLAKFSHFQKTLKRIKALVFPYMVPLTSVYFFEYLINQAVSPTLLFDIETSPFSKFRDIYVTYGTFYQLGVFVSRSSSSFVRVHNLYIPSILQALNLVILLIQSIYSFIPNVYIVIAIIFYEGLLGGASYVNTFMNVTESLEGEEREFALGAVTVSDSFGILIAALIGLWLEPQLCAFQVDHGKDWCRLE
ncbi:hypothetical protein WICMUC_002740 [Wickerhamomyces mucosus]|uniref:Protein BTN n=1 Tax=Wickerhamomyces mucosus TaxID=1378264 RepID=A0A9P8TE07_9ASCO|nr:hypothetical protein WICMUC_002740 [Wickerhamomyces mucosus]